MKNQVIYLVLLIGLTFTRADTEELPLCPTNFQYFPQSLPMHCRLPTGADFPVYPGMPGITAQTPPADKQPMPMPVAMPPGMPMPMPGAIPMPGSMMPMPGPMMPGSAPGHKLPVIVMPFYSPDTSFKKSERPRRPGGTRWKKPKAPHESTESSSDTDISSETSGTGSSENGWWNGNKNGWRKNGRRSSKGHHSHHRSKRRHSKKKKDLLTPVLQYVTNDGYVIYEKTISKGEAKDWLRVNKDEQKPEERPEGKDDDDLDASIHEKRNMKVEEAMNMNRDKRGEDNRENDEEGSNEDGKDKEVTTPKAHLRRHHRKGIPPAINKLLPKRAF